MALGDHLNELRRRLIVAAVAVLVMLVPGWLLYTPIIQRLQTPLRAHQANLNFGSMTDAFALQLQMAVVVAVVIASPVWLYQLWAFVAPGLTRRERRLTAAFAGSALPLFLVGSWIGYSTLDKAIEILTNFVPEGSLNIIAAVPYLLFATKLIVAFGVAFLMPILLVGLNAAGLLSAQSMLRVWRFAFILILVFAAFLTPTPDPWTMFTLAAPMWVLYFAACGVAWLIDRRRTKATPEWRRELDRESDAAHTLDTSDGP